jgi:hypothetical protein|tara:strand:+ start:917 stop:1132 length:216 start_codon:yes stop_codon:yes gene_type:complete
MGAFIPEVLVFIATVVMAIDKIRALKGKSNKMQSGHCLLKLLASAMQLIAKIIIVIIEIRLNVTPWSVNTH